MMSDKQRQELLDKYRHFHYLQYYGKTHREMDDSTHTDLLERVKARNLARDKKRKKDLKSRDRKRKKDLKSKQLLEVGDLVTNRDGEIGILIEKKNDSMARVFIEKRYRKVAYRNLKKLSNKNT
tara:strand:+ start:1692 stop:2063 length:372 start_codon:yes stop_codon:yes gene_type:complete